MQYEAKASSDFSCINDKTITWYTKNNKVPNASLVDKILIKIASNNKIYYDVDIMLSVPFDIRIKVIKIKAMQEAIECIKNKPTHFKPMIYYTDEYFEDGTRLIYLDETVNASTSYTVTNVIEAFSFFNTTLNYKCEFKFRLATLRDRLNLYINNISRCNLTLLFGPLYLTIFLPLIAKDVFTPNGSPYIPISALLFILKLSLKS